MHAVIRQSVKCSSEVRENFAAAWGSPRVMLWHMAVQDASSLGPVFVSTRLEQTFRMLPQTRIKGLRRLPCASRFFITSLHFNS
jgi:hypothetical protein